MWALNVTFCVSPPPLFFFSFSSPSLTLPFLLSSLFVLKCCHFRFDGGPGKAVFNHISTVHTLMLLWLDSRKGNELSVVLAEQSSTTSPLCIHLCCCGLIQGKVMSYLWSWQNSLQPHLHCAYTYVVVAWFEERWMSYLWNWKENRHLCSLHLKSCSLFWFQHFRKTCLLLIILYHYQCLCKNMPAFVVVQIEHFSVPLFTVDMNFYMCCNV